jgi:hypothetical protein
MTQQRYDSSDPYSPYEDGLNRLLDKLGRDHPRFKEILTYQQRLQENLRQIRRHGDTEIRKAERSEIISHLIEIALAELGVSYNELCDPISSRPAWRATDREVPKLKHSQRVDPLRGLAIPGIMFTDDDPVKGNPQLYLSVYFKTSRFFGDFSPRNEKWLYLEVHMRPAFSLRVQVRAWNNRDVFEFLEVLRGESEWMSGYDLHGPRPESNEDHPGDYFLTWRESGENRLMLSTFTSTNAGISIHVRLTDEVASEFADYLDEVGFSKPFE